jgi:hypothetical protein
VTRGIGAGGTAVLTDDRVDRPIADSGLSTSPPSYSRRKCSLATSAKAILTGTRQHLSSAVPCVSSLCGHVSAIIQERPRLMLGLLTALTGAVGTTWLATRVPRHQTVRRRLRRSRKQFGAALTLLPLAIEVLSKPSVNAYLRRTMMRELSRRLGR